MRQTPARPRGGLLSPAAPAFNTFFGMVVRSASRAAVCMVTSMTHTRRNRSRNYDDANHTSVGARRPPLRDQPTPTAQTAHCPPVRYRFLFILQRRIPPAYKQTSRAPVTGRNTNKRITSARWCRLADENHLDKVCIRARSVR